MSGELESILSLVYCGNGIVFAGGGYGFSNGDIYKSTDFGATWTTSYDGPPELEGIYSLVYCGNGIVLAGGGYTGGDGDIYRSTDFGVNWTKVYNTSLEAIYSLVYCGNGIVLAGGDGDIYKSTNFGITWTQIEMDNSLESILSLVYCGNGIVLAGGGSDGGDGDIYRSDVGFSQGGTSAAGVLNAIGSANQVLYKNASNVATTSSNFTFNGTTAISVNGVVNVGNGVNTGFHGDSTNLAVRVPNANGGFYVQSPGNNSDWALFQSTGLTLNGNITVSSGNATGGGIILADDGDIVDLNDSFCSMRFSGGVRIFSANKSGSSVITLANSGNISATANVTAYSSDRRLKENLKHIESPLQKIQKLNGYTFDWNEKSKELGFIPKHEKCDIGLIAQEVEEVLPQAIALAPFDMEHTKNGFVSKSKENYLTIQYERIVPLLIEAIKEQQRDINNLQNRIEILEGN